MLLDPRIEAFRHHQPALEATAHALREQMRKLVEGLPFPVHFVEARVKAEDSLRRKLARPDRTYATLWQVTDLVGLRVATYFEDAIDVIAARIEARLEVDLERSTNKSHTSSFGYRSVHYVCRDSRGTLPSDFRFEIQLRTVLQHAWAEIEHDLGYKADTPIPIAIRRRFSRVASLLEIADEEFVSIRRELDEARQRSLSTTDRSQPLDVLSIQPFAEDARVVAADTQLAAWLGVPRGGDAFYPAYLARTLRGVGIEDVGALDLAIARRASEVVATAPLYFAFATTHLGLERGRIESVQPGYSLLFIAYLHAVRAPELALAKVSRIARLLLDLDGLNDEARAQTVATALIAAMGEPPA